MCVCVCVCIYVCVYVCVCVCVCVLDKQEIILKTHLFSKLFRFLYRSFVSLIKI